MQRYQFWQQSSHVPGVVKALLLPFVKLTSQDGAVQHITPDAVAQLSIDRFANLYTVLDHNDNYTLLLLFTRIHLWSSRSCTRPLCMRGNHVTTSAIGHEPACLALHVE